MKKFTSVAICLLFVLSASAQSAEKKGVIYNKELSAGIEIHTSGWGVFLDKVHRNTLVKKTLWEIGFTQIHHPKEVKQSLDLGYNFFGWDSPKPFTGQLQLICITII